ncbi:MAG: T9SS type A sorting domain-containing protein [Bacteroidota bacterium]
MKKIYFKMIALVIFLPFALSVANAQKITPSCLTADPNAVIKTQPTLSAGSNSKAVLLAESFDAVTFPPTGWLNVAGTGTYTWVRLTTSVYPSGITPHTGAAMASYPSWTASSGNFASLISPVVDLTGNTGAFTVTFWMYHEAGYTNADNIEAYVNTTASLTGATLLGVASRPIGSGWLEHSFTIPGTYNTATNYILFKGLSAYGNDIHMDDISVNSPEAHDMGVTAITPTFVLSGATVTPSVTLKNFGGNDEATWSVTLSDGGLYTSTKANLSTITAGSTLVVPMDNWSPADGSYTLTATLTMAGDLNATNDVLTTPCIVMGLSDAYAGNTTALTYNTFDLASGAPTSVGTIGSSPFPMAEEYNGTAIYRIYNDLTIGTVGADGSYTALGTMTGVTGTPTGIAWNWVTSTMYVVVLNGSNLPQLCTLNMSTLALTLVGTGAQGMIIAMDFADNGLLYAPSLSPDSLYSIDPATGATTLVGPLGVNINYGQDVSWDGVDDKLYTITCGAVYQFGTYDITTGAFTMIADMGTDQYATFVITKTPIVGISNENPTPTAYAFPNPSNDNIKIGATQKFNKISVINVLGSTVFTENVDTNNYMLNVSSLKAGIYLVQLDTEYGTITKKIQVLD